MHNALLLEGAITDDSSHITVSGDATCKTFDHSSFIAACVGIGANIGKVI